MVSLGRGENVHTAIERPRALEGPSFVRPPDTLRPSVSLASTTTLAKATAISLMPSTLCSAALLFRQCSTTAPASQDGPKAVKIVLHFLVGKSLEVLLRDVQPSVALF